MTKRKPKRAPTKRKPKRATKRKPSGLERVLFVRVDAALLKRIDRSLKYERVYNPGCSRAAWIRRLLRKALQS